MRVVRLASAVLPPLVWGVAFVAAWEALVRGFDLKPYFLPAPTAIWSAFTDNLGLVRAAAFVSGGNALVGLLLGIALGVAALIVILSVMNGFEGELRSRLPVSYTHLTLPTICSV